MNRALDSPPIVRTCSRRRLLVAAAAAGSVAAATSLLPLIASLQPSERARAGGAHVEVDLSALKAGEMMIVEWRGKPVWILHRTPAMLAALDRLGPRLADPASNRLMQPAYARNTRRSIDPAYLVVVGMCTHLGCSPAEKLRRGADSGLDGDWPGGFLCPCHGSTYDLAGRVYRNKPAPDNLEVPPHKYLAEARLLIGEDDRLA